jgi:hypothetical protein
MQEQKAAPAQQRTTIAEKVDIAAGLALFPAITVMVFMRRKLGYRFLSPIKLFVMFLILWAVGGVSTIVNAKTQTATYGGTSISATATSPADGLAPFIFFALAMLIVGMIERYLRWRDIKKGVSWHTYSRGISWFSFLPFNDTIIKRYIDPAACLIVGLLVMLVFKWLGYYIILSAFCLFLFEAVDYERAINRMLDVLDSLVESEVVSENVEFYTTGKPTEKPIEQTAGIPTGVSPDLAAAIERKRQKQQRQPQQVQQPQQTAQGYPMQQQSLYPPQPQPQQVQFPPQGYGQQEPTGQLRRQHPDNLANS